MTYQRAGTDFYRTQLDGKTVTWIDGDEGTGRRIVAVLDSEATHVARRMLRDGSTELLPGEARGLTVYGTHKWDRPTFAEFGALAPDYAYLAQGITDGRGLTYGPHGLILTAETLKDWMTAHGYSVRRLASVLGINPSTVQRWRDKDHEVPAYLGLALDRLASTTTEAP